MRSYDVTAICGLAYLALIMLLAIVLPFAVAGLIGYGLFKVLSA